MTTTQESVLDRLVDALEGVDQVRLEGVLAADVRIRASLPSRDVERTGRAAAAVLMMGWFRDCTRIVRLHSGVDTVGDVWHAAYRFAVREAGEDCVVEQQAYCTLADGLVDTIRIMCSGFRPIGGPDTDARPHADVTLDSLGEGCATLTPRIAAAMRALLPGQVLAVRTDDPAAPEGIAAWSRLTGHEMVGAAAEPGGTRFLLRHRSHDHRPSIEEAS